MAALPLGEDYIHIEPLTKGGMGWLYKAYRRGLQVEVVIKRVREQYVGKMDQRAEADILKRLKHRYLPRIYDVINGGDGYLYTVMDYIPGVNMQQYVEQNGPAGQKLAHKWACQLCEVAAYLHEQKPPIIHCDIKPGNLMITPSGDICLVDFNTSLVFSSGILAVGATSGYAAPEQYSRPAVPPPGVPAGQPTELLPEDGGFAPSGRPSFSAAFSARAGGYGGVTGRTDVYGIGATLYFLVTGRVPEKALGPVTPVSAWSPEISGTFCSIIRRAMEKAPEDRFPDAGRMLEALRDIDRLDARYRRYRMFRWGSNLLVCLLFLCGAAMALYGGVRLRAERDNAYLSLVTQGEALARQGETERAEAALAGAIRSAPGRAEGYLALSAQLYARGAYPEAAALIQDAVEAGSLPLDSLPDDQAGDLLYIQANCAYEMEDYAAAAGLYRQALDRRTDNPAYYRGLALAQARSGALEEAHRTLDILAEREADSVDCVIIRAELDLVQGEYRTAFDQYAEAAGRTDDPQVLSRVYLSGAEALRELGDLDGYIGWLSQGVGRLGENGTLQAELLAAGYAEKALADPENAPEWYGLAKTHLQRVVDSGRGNILTGLNLAVVQQNLGEYEEAEGRLLALRDQYPSDYRVYMRLSFLYAGWQSRKPAEERDYAGALANYDLAAPHYEQAVASGETDDEMLRLEALMEQLRLSGWLE